MQINMLCVPIGPVYTPAIALAEARVALDSLRQARASSALPTVEALPEGDLLQTNLKTVWRIYLDWCASGVAQLTEAQFDTISDIAHQCPLEGGRAVLIARGLYRTLQDKHFDDDTLCPSTEARHAMRSPAQAPEQVQVRPNPASDRVRLSLPSGTDEPVQVQLFDLAGRLAFETTGTPSDGILDLNLATLKTGLYVCRVSVAEHQFEPVKISIIR